MTAESIVNPNFTDQSTEGWTISFSGSFPVGSANDSHPIMRLPLFSPSNDGIVILAPFDIPNFDQYDSPMVGLYSRDNTASESETSIVGTFVSDPFLLPMFTDDNPPIVVEVSFDYSIVRKFHSDPDAEEGSTDPFYLDARPEHAIIPTEIGVEIKVTYYSDTEATSEIITYSDFQSIAYSNNEFGGYRASVRKTPPENSQSMMVTVVCQLPGWPWYIIAGGRPSNEVASWQHALVISGVNVGTPSEEELFRKYSLKLKTKEGWRTITEQSGYDPAPGTGVLKLKLPEEDRVPHSLYHWATHHAGGRYPLRLFNGVEWIDVLRMTNNPFENGATLTLTFQEAKWGTSHRRVWSLFRDVEAGTRRAEYEDYSYWSVGVTSAFHRFSEIYLPTEEQSLYSDTPNPWYEIEETSDPENPFVINIIEPYPDRGVSVYPSLNERDQRFYLDLDRIRQSGPGNGEIANLQIRLSLYFSMEMFYTIRHVGGQFNIANNSSSIFVNETNRISQNATGGSVELRMAPWTGSSNIVDPSQSIVPLWLRNELYRGGGVIGESSLTGGPNSVIPVGELVHSWSENSGLETSGNPGSTMYYYVNNFTYDVPNRLLTNSALMFQIFARRPDFGMIETTNWPYTESTTYWDGNIYVIRIAPELSYGSMQAEFGTETNVSNITMRADWSY